jgi:hypothetical protein
LGSDPLLWLDAAALRGQRWDPGYWDPRLRDPLAGCVHPLATLGDFVAADGITYGRILPGRRPPVGEGPLYVTQKAVRPTGLDLTRCARIAEGCDWDTARARIRPGDLLIPRSGVATLARGVMSIFLEDEPAVVDCFTDRVSLDGYPSPVATLFLRARPGWLQIYRQINGVGPPNLSFDEIRGLRLPMFPSDVRQAHLEAYARVHLAHLAWIARQRVCAEVGLDPASDDHAGELRRAAQRALRVAVLGVERSVFDPDCRDMS